MTRRGSQSSPTTLCVRCHRPIDETSFYIGQDGPFCEQCAGEVSPRGKGGHSWIAWLASLWNR